MICVRDLVESRWFMPGAYLVVGIWGIVGIIVTG